MANETHPYDPRFEVGDLVELNSGGPPMTVREVTRQVKEMSYDVSCTWLNDEDEQRSAWFDERMLHPWEGDEGDTELQRAKDEKLAAEAMELAAPSLRRVWDNPEDAAYDQFATAPAPANGVVVAQSVGDQRAKDEKLAAEAMELAPAMEVRQSAGDRSATIAPGVRYVPPGTPPNPYTTAAVKPDGDASIIAQTLPRDCGPLLCACGIVCAPAAGRDDHFCSCGREWRRYGAGAGHVVWWCKESPPPNVAIQLAPDWDDTTPTERKKQLAAAVRRGMSTPAPAIAAEDRRARCGDATCSGNCPPKVIHLQDGMTWSGTARPFCGAPWQGAVMAHRSLWDALNLRPGEERCIGCAERDHRLKAEEMQPSAVAAAPAPRPRLTVFCQGDDD